MLGRFYVERNHQRATKRRKHWTIRSKQGPPHLSHTNQLKEKIEKTVRSKCKRVNEWVILLIRTSNVAFLRACLGLHLQPACFHHHILLREISPSKGIIMVRRLLQSLSVEAFLWFPQTLVCLLGLGSSISVEVPSLLDVSSLESLV